MKTKSFDEFVKKSNESPSKDEVDWNATLKEWQDNLTSFYSKVERILEPYVSAEQIHLKKTKMELREEFLGTYEVDSLSINIGRINVDLKPIGTLLIGAKGRVDMIGPKGTIKFVLVPDAVEGPNASLGLAAYLSGNIDKVENLSERKWDWKISTPPPKIKYRDINEKSIQQALMEVSNG